MTQEERREKWKALVASYQSRGEQTGAQWCATHGVNLRQLWYWLRKFKEAESPSRHSSAEWVPLELEESAQQKPAPVSRSSSLLLKVGPATIKVKPGYDADLLTDVVRTLKSIC